MGVREASEWTMQLEPCVVSLQTVTRSLISLKELLTTDTEQAAQPHIQVQCVSLAGTIAIHEDFANGTRITTISLHTSRIAKEERSSSLYSS